MAARKSCTTLSWAEAKTRSGVGSDSKGIKKNKEVLRKQDHGAVLAAKIIKKQGGDAASADNKKLEKAYRKLEEKNAAIAAKREEEREMKRLASLQEVKPYDMAKDKLSEIMLQLREKETDNLPKVDTCSSAGDLNQEESNKEKIAECKQMQADEIMALEAMIPEEDFIVSNASKFSDLKEKLEQMDNDSVVKHPPISFLIKLDIDDYRYEKGEGEADMALNALVLIRVTLPPLYLNSEDSQAPVWDFEYVMVTDKNAFCSADKPLESLAWLNESDIKEAMTKHAEEVLLPYPCVYEVAVTWLSENIFSYLNMYPHLLATKS